VSASAASEPGNHNGSKGPLASNSFARPACGAAPKGPQAAMPTSLQDILEELRGAGVMNYGLIHSVIWRSLGTVTQAACGVSSQVELGKAMKCWPRTTCPSRTSQ
jgi:hypothetical protein